MDASERLNHEKKCAMNRAGTQGHSLRRELRNFKQVTSSSMASPAIAASWKKQVDSSLSKNQALI